MTRPDFKYEIPLFTRGIFVVGVDEVGRGCLAGPVMAGAVAFDFKKINQKDILKLGINDSKKLTPLKREKLSKELEKIAFFETSEVSSELIDKKGIVWAINTAMRKAGFGLAKKLSAKLEDAYFLVDGYKFESSKFGNQLAIIKGDSLSVSIASASIIAKVKRDSLMTKLSREFPNYDWQNNKGYGTNKHKEAIEKFGLTKHHRRSFCTNYLITSS